MGFVSDRCAILLYMLMVCVMSEPQMYSTCKDLSAKSQHVCKIMVSFFATIASLAVAVSGAAVEQRCCGPTVDLGYASYYGTRLEAGVDQYLGMRYARAPLGNLRFRAPQEPSQLCKPQDATKVSIASFHFILGTADFGTTVSPHLRRHKSNSRPRYRRRLSLCQHLYSQCRYSGF